jgi:phage-related baseplate assembly protein
MALTDKPVFVSTDPNAIAQEMKSYFEGLVAKKIEPAQIEQLLINGWAYRESIIRNQINSAAVQNLVRFATAPILDYLGEFVGVVRIPAQPAGCQISFTLVGNTVPIVIPEGTRIASTDQRVFFRTIEAVNVPANTSAVTVSALCETEGLDGNGYNPADISVIQDPQPFVVSAVNTNITTGGAPEETDEQMRERIRLAPYQFSTAGSVGAYKFWTLTAHPSIIDAGVPKIPTTPGTVNVYPLIDSGEVTPSEIIEAVEGVLNAENRIPTTDTVVVTSPTRIDYALEIQLVLFTEAVQDDVVDKVTENADAFVFEKRRKLGRDVIESQIKSALQKGVEDSIYKMTLVGFSDIIVPENSFPFCTGITITVTGTTNG